MSFSKIRKHLKSIWPKPAVLFFVCLSGAAHSETLLVRSNNPFNFSEVFSNRETETIELKVKLSLPTGTPPAAGYPAILFVHGAGGPQRYHRTWLDMFNEMGVATAVADHFTPRGKVSAVGSHIQLTGAAMTSDAYRILNALVDDRRIDAEHIAIMGASKGGGVSLYTTWKPLQRKLSPKHRFAAHIALYPTCVSWDVPEATGSPVLVLLGARDNWTGVDHCRDSVSEFRKAGFGNFTLKVYPGANHGFDSDLPARRILNALSVAHCKFTISVDGTDFASGLKMDTPVAKRKALAACARRGVDFGGNAEALQNAKTDVVDFVKRSAFATSSNEN